MTPPPAQYKRSTGSHPSSPPEPLPSPPLPPPSTDLRYPFTRRTFGSFLWPGQPDDCGSAGHVKVTSRALAAAAARTEAARQNAPPNRGSLIKHWGELSSSPSFTPRYPPGLFSLASRFQKQGEHDVEINTRTGAAAKRGD